MCRLHTLVILDRLCYNGSLDTKITVNVIVSHKNVFVLFLSFQHFSRLLRTVLCQFCSFFMVILSFQSINAEVLETVNVLSRKPVSHPLLSLSHINVLRWLLSSVRMWI